MEKPEKTGADRPAPGALVYSPPRNLEHCRTSTRYKALSLVSFGGVGAAMALYCVRSLYTWDLAGFLLALLVILAWNERRP